MQVRSIGASNRRGTVFGVDQRTVQAEDASAE